MPFRLRRTVRSAGTVKGERVTVVPLMNPVEFCEVSDTTWLDPDGEERPSGSSSMKLWGPGGTLGAVFGPSYRSSMTAGDMESLEDAAD